MLHPYELPLVVVFCALWRSWLQMFPFAGWPGCTITTQVGAIANCVVWLAAVNLYISTHLGFEKVDNVIIGSLVAAGTWIISRHLPVPRSQPYIGAAVLGSLTGIFLFVFGNWEL